MAWISLLLFVLDIRAAELPRFLTKHSPETLRFISMDGRYAYIQKRPGVLGLVSSFKSTDFISDASNSDFLVKASRFKQRIAIEAIPNAHDEFSLLKNHKVFVVDYGNSSPREVGLGRGAKLHLGDEWITYYDSYAKTIYIQNLVTQKKYSIKLSPKPNPFFIPDVEMINSHLVVYTDINEHGNTAMISYDLTTQKSNIIYKASQTGTRMELCQSENYLAIGEFPYEGVNRGSKILYLNTKTYITLAGYSTVYSSVEQDIGNIVCAPQGIYFIKTMEQNKKLNYKITEAVRLDIQSGQVEAKSNLKHVGQIIEMDGRILIPYRSEFYVLEGKSNIGEDILKSTPNKEELQLDL